MAGLFDQQPTHAHTHADAQPFCSFSLLLFLFCGARDIHTTITHRTTTIMADTGEVPPLQPEARFVDTKALRGAVAKEFKRCGRSFSASKNGGSRQKIYLCSGRDGGCKAEVRAYKGAGSEEWKIHSVVSDHTGCSGGKTPGRSVAFDDVARQAMNDNPTLQGIALKRKIERDTGIKVKHRTATRMKNRAKKEGQAAVVDSYQLLSSFCEQLQENCPGTIAEVQVRCRFCSVVAVHCVITQRVCATNSRIGTNHTAVVVVHTGLRTLRVCLT